MCKQKGFLLIEAVMAIAFLVVIMLTIQYGNHVRIAAQLASMQRLHVLRVTHNIVDGAVHDRDCTLALLPEGFTGELCEVPVSMPAGAEHENRYQFKHRYVTLRWRTSQGKEQAMKIYSGVLHT